MDAIETYEHAGLTINIYPDEGPESPRGWDNAGKLVIYSGRRGNFQEVNELDMTFRPDDYAGWDELEKNVMECYPKCELLPVYRFEHSDVAYSTTPFGDRFDSGRVGFILCERETIIKEWGKKIASAYARRKARECMVCEVETYSLWANGEVYGYVLTDERGDDLPGEYQDSVWGYYGLEDVKEAAEEAADTIGPKWAAGAVSRAAAALEAALEAAGQQRLSLEA